MFELKSLSEDSGLTCSSCERSPSPAITTQDNKVWCRECYLRESRFPITSVMLSAEKLFAKLKKAPAVSVVLIETRHKLRIGLRVTKQAFVEMKDNLPFARIGLTGPSGKEQIWGLGEIQPGTPIVGGGVVLALQ